MPFRPPHTGNRRREPAILGGGVGKLVFRERRIIIEGDDGTEYYVFSLRGGDYIHGDKVEYIVTRKAIERKLPEARPIRVVKRSSEELLMRVEKKDGKALYRLMDISGDRIVRPIHPPIDAHDGDIYRVVYRDMRHPTVIGYFGSIHDTSILEDILFFQRGVRHTWPAELRDIEVAPLPSFAPPQMTTDTRALRGEALIPQSRKIGDTDLFARIELPGAKKPRLDLRLWPTMTIDGADAKDLDDAISIARYEGGDYLIGVHIADVAEYVVEYTPLDTEAYLRGTSIYTPGRVIPMLPEVLSNDRCSLHPGGPKLTLSIIMRVDSMGNVRESYVTESVIESMKKGVYDEVWEVLDAIEGSSGGSGENTVGVRGEQKSEGQSGRVYSPPKLLDTFGYKSIVTESSYPPRDILMHFSDLYKILEKRRAKEGKILFETTECYFDLDSDRNVRHIRKRERNDAHMMIEEFMVLANEEVAKWCQTKGIPFLSRVHDAPSAEKTREIHELISMDTMDRHGGMVSVEVSDRELTPHEIRTILEQARERGDIYRFSRLLLPKMSKAVYQDKKHRHFGLALEYYAHFTSPIRRYPDLLLHRMIKKYLHSELGKEKSEYAKNMKKWGISLSEKERAAEEISRSIDSLYMCRYMSGFVGQRFNGTISGLTESNIYVELASGVEGSIYIGKGAPRQIHLTLDMARGALIDKTGALIYRIGDTIRVNIREVDIEHRRIEMEAV